MVVSRVAGDGGDDERQRDQRRRQRAAGIHRGQRARGEQQRISWQERRHHEAGLGEHDGEEDEVHPEPVVAQQFDQVGVEMQDDIDEPVDRGSMRASFPRRAARARRHAGRRLGLAPLQQFERGVHTGILACQRLAYARVVEIERNAVDVLEVVVRIDAVALDGAARRREVSARW